LAIEEDCPGERVFSLALVKPNVDPAAQLRILHPLEHEDRALQPADFTQSDRKAVLPRIAAYLADDKRGNDRAVANGSSQTEDFAPLGSNQPEVELATNDRRKCQMTIIVVGDIKPLVSQMNELRTNWRFNLGNATPSGNTGSESVKRSPMKRF